MKKIFALGLGAIMTLSMVSCGSDKTSNTVSDSGTRNVVVSDAVSEKEEKENDKSTAEFDYSYWEEICNDYDAYYDRMPQDTFVAGKEIQCYARDELHVIDLENYTMTSLNDMLEDVKICGRTSEADERYLLDNKIYICNEYKDGFLLLCQDLDGNVIGEYQLEEGNDYPYLDFYRLKEDGGIIFSTYNKASDKHRFFSTSPDLSEQWQIYVTCDNGEKIEDFDSHIILLYDNKLYLYFDGDFYTVDVNTNETQTLASDKYQFFVGKKNRKHFGKYYMAENTVYNIETGEILCDYKGIISMKGHYWYTTTQNDDHYNELRKYILPANWQEFAENQSDFEHKYGEIIYTAKVIPSGIRGIDENYALLESNHNFTLIDLQTGEDHPLTYID